MGQEGGDSTALSVFAVVDGALVRATVTGDVLLLNGFSGDGTRHQTYSAGDGAALYTSVAIDDSTVEVYSWTLDGTDLVPRLLGTYPAG